MLKHLRRWYQGQGKIQEFESAPDSAVWIAPLFYTEYHWTARVARALVAFYLRQWQWLWGTLIALAGFYFTVFPRK